MKITKKDKLLMLVLHALLLIYIIIIGVVYVEKGFNMSIGGTSGIWSWGMLVAMFILELLSTLTFTLRIYYTDKKFNLAAMFGTLSWIIAGLQGLLFITGDIDFGTYLFVDPVTGPEYKYIHSANFVYSFLTKIPVIGLATYGGIYFNLKYLTPAINKRNIKI